MIVGVGKIYRNLLKIHREVKLFKLLLLFDTIIQEKV